MKKPPKTVGDVRSLLGFVGYYRSFIKNFSQRAKILYDLLCKDKTDTCNGKKMKAKNIQRPSSDKVDWTSEHQSVLEELLKQLKEPPIMAYADFALPFFVHCDASEKGLGAILYQEHGDA